MSNSLSGNADPLAAVLGRLPSGLFILTLRHEQQETGMLASWVMQAGFEPPMVTIAIRHGRYVAQWLDDGASLAVHVLGTSQRRLIAHFGRGFAPGEPAFEKVPIRHSERGVPILTDALGYLECTARGHVDSHDHRIYLAEVVAGELAGDEPPYVHIRNSGRNY
jgi:flavin reductase (DIM6/NTAB) family NADH-FMN oxidoreductase RutF